MPARPDAQASLSVSRVGFERGTQKLLEDVSFVVGPRTRLGVVGPNGVGKSTLLKILAGLERPSTGTVTLAPPAATVGYLAQEHERGGERVEEFLRRSTGALAADAELASSAAGLADATDAAADRYELALERWSSLGIDTLEGRIEAVLRELGLDPSVASVETGALSGGERARAGLAAILLSRFDVTLLDEPTNDLDYAGLELLEGFVRRRNGGLVIVSHDRSFLDSAVDSVLEIDEHDHRARLYEGGWSSYLEEREVARRHATEDHATYQTRRKALLERARRERQWATSGVAKEQKKPRDADKAQRGFRMNRTEKLAGRARMTERAIERLEPVAKPWEGWELRLELNEAPRSGSDVASLTAAVLGRGSFRLGPFDLDVAFGERIALEGPNGSGKTTVLGALLGRVPLLSGERRFGPSVVVGELAQDRSAGQEPLVGAFTSRTGLTTPDARTLLAKFGLSAAHVERPLAALSPGERTRVELAGFQAVGVNLLVLDEPTNHLDLLAIEQLEEALAAYSGTLIVVSHDRRFLESLEVSRRVDVSAFASRRAAADEVAVAGEARQADASGRTGS